MAVDAHAARAREEAPRERPKPPAPAEQTPEKAPPDVADPPAPRRRWIRRGLFALLPLALLGGAYWYVTGGAVVSIEDAYVNGETVGVSTDVSGLVSEVDVTDNERVRRGQTLYRINPLPFQIALDNAKANLAETALTLESMKRDYQRMLTDAAAQKDQVALDQVNYDRAAALVKQADTPRSTYDQANTTLRADQAKFKSLQEQAQVQLAKLGGNADAPTEQLPQYQQAKAQVDEAQRQLDDATVKAAFDGVVTGVPATTPGRYLAASTVAFYLVDLDHVWIDAQPKETALTYVRKGQPVTITVDAYPNRSWRGSVESLSPAASQQFSLLPAQNTSGNWVKVVQRVPLRVSVDASDSRGKPPLRAGMSAEIGIDTGHPRGVPHFLKSWF